MRATRHAAGMLVLSLWLAAEASAQGALEGRVLSDSAKRPIAGARVALEGTTRESVTDSSGHFETGDAPSGRRRVVIRAAGYAVDSLTLEIFDGQNVVRDFVLTRGVTALAAVEVKAPAAPDHPDIVGFDERRKRGLGKYIDSTMLARFVNARTSDALASLSNLSIRYGSSKAWVASTRAPAATKCALVQCGGGTPGLVDVADLNAGAREACYTDIYLNGVLAYQFGVNPPMPLFDVNSLRPADILGVEVYVNAASAPAQFSRVTSDCGVMIIWLRR
jgi:hypothetical protein